MRLNVVVEGRSEEGFVKRVLAPHLWTRGVYPVARAVKTGRKRGYDLRGGLLKSIHLDNDLRRWMSEDAGGGVRFTTLVDLYRLPADLHGRNRDAPVSDAYEQVEAIEAALADRIGEPRFIPYVQLHEFEALLLADPRQFDWEFPDREREIDTLVTLAGSVRSPELIDDGHATAPSKRIIRVIPEYEGRKASAAPVIAAKIGIETMRARCPHFAAWLARLEGLGTSVGA